MGQEGIATDTLVHKYVTSHDVRVVADYFSSYGEGLGAEPNLPITPAQNLLKEAFKACDATMLQGVSIKV